MKTSAGAAERRLRIALLVDRFGNRFGGAEAYGVELMRVLGERHDISVVARDYDSDLPFP
ncbi:glycosyltransferase family 1 protein, partial [Cupriavidus sp. SIMBA_020]